MLSNLLEGVDSKCHRGSKYDRDMSSFVEKIFVPMLAGNSVRSG